MMRVSTELRELASEVTLSLLAITPGVSVVSKLIPKTFEKHVKAIYGVDRVSSLETAFRMALDAATSAVLDDLGAKPGSHEYGATHSAVADFRLALSETPLDVSLIASSLVDPVKLADAIRAHCPAEHRKWASDLRRKTFERILEAFCGAILAMAPQVPTVSTALAIETLRQISEIRSCLQK
jgi:hypothetical protein